LERLVLAIDFSRPDTILGLFSHHPFVFMSTLDWIVLFGTLVLIVVYGVWKTRGSQDMQGYLLGNKSTPWWGVGLSIMATQASAITFLSTPGQAYEDGMRFLQFYFGLPLAMIILSVTAVPLFHRLKVYTAYEYLESRFDLKVRSLAAFFFLCLRGISVGITIYAPSLILSTILGWNITLTTILIGTMVMIYVTSGGTRAVSHTQKYQLTIIMCGMILAGWTAFSKIPAGIGFGDTFRLAGELGKLNLINLEFNLSDRYNIWSGLIGGLFLFMSYFGADQSQVGRYLGGKSIAESRLGLIFNGLLKIPMQFIILYIGILVFVFYQFVQPPVFHNQTLLNQAREKSEDIVRQETVYSEIHKQKSEATLNLATAMKGGNQEEMNSIKEELEILKGKEKAVREEVKKSISVAIPGASTLDKDYVFINFVMNYLPHGLIGLLMAVVFMAAMSSTASELNALASTTMVDIYKRSINPNKTDVHYVKYSRAFTIMWAVFAMAFASIANQAENLIQFVNIMGSLFYGTILGIFVSAFYIKYIKSTSVFYAAIVAESVILYLYFFQRDAVAFLHYNYIGCAIVVVVGGGIEWVSRLGKDPYEGSARR
jgi:solute:Na+ symporter, SSS family